MNSRSSANTAPYELLTLIILVLLCLWSVRPLLEEWDFFQVFQNSGLRYTFAFLEKNAWRPLHIFSYAFQWVLGLEAHTYGVALFAAITLVSRYLVLRWALRPLIADPSTRWLVATVAAVLPGWSGVWLGRYASAQISAVCFFVVLGCCIRIDRRGSLRYALIATLSLVLMLMVYQALALCVLAVPVLLWYRRRCEPVAGTARRLISVSDIRVAGTLAAGLLLYVMYGMTAQKLAGSGGYESDMAGGLHELLQPAGLWLHIRLAYATVWLSDDALMPFWLLIVAAAVMFFRLPDQAGAKGRHIFGMAVCFCALPLLSLTYVSQSHLNDPERIIFPAVTGLIMILILIASSGAVGVQQAADDKNGPAVWTKWLVIAGLLSSAALTASSVQRYGRIQTEVLAQIPTAAIATTHKLVIQDYSGTLGDVYTFYEASLGQALAVRKQNAKAVICTPANVDRRHPVAQRFPVSSTPRCEALPDGMEGATILNARQENGHIILFP